MIKTLHESHQIWRIAEAGINGIVYNLEPWFSLLFDASGLLFESNEIK